MMMRNISSDKKYNVKFVIIEENLTPILGLRASKVIKFITVNESNVMKESDFHLLESCRTPQDIVKQFHSVFHDKVSTLPGVLLFCFLRRLNSVALLIYI